MESSSALRSGGTFTPARCRSEAVQEALQAVTRMMRRYGRRLRDDEREELLRIIDEQTALLAAR